MHTQEMRIYPETNSVTGTWSNPNQNVKDKDIDHLEIVENKPGWFLIGSKKDEYTEAAETIYSAFSGKPVEKQTFKVYRTHHYGVSPGTVHVNSSTIGLVPMDCKIKKI